MMQPSQIELLMQKLQSLRPDRIAEVEDFIDFLKSRDEERFSARAALKATEPVLERVWDNADDAEYDQL
jgi:hypothetical protein